MDKIRDTAAFLNPEHTPDTMALARYGEDKFVVMFGELHIEMAELKLIGTLLQDSG